MILLKAGLFFGGLGVIVLFDRWGIEPSHSGNRLAPIAWGCAFGLPMIAQALWPGLINQLVW